MKRLLFFAALVVAAFTVIIGSAAAGSAPVKTSVIYDSTLPNGPATNLPSVAFEATSTSEFGGALALSSAAGRSLTNVTVSMSSWACVSGAWFTRDCSTPAGATFQQPITLNIYKADGTTKLGSFTQTFSIPYRPSAATAAQCGGDTTAWYQPARGHSAGGCYHGILSNVTFNVSGVTVPSDGIVYGIAYNTSDYGANPTHAGGPVDSLNVALNSLSPLPAGTGDVWQNSTWSGEYCDGGTIGTFRADLGDGSNDGCWSPYTPAVQFKAGS